MYLDGVEGMVLMTSENAPLTDNLLTGTLDATEHSISLAVFTRFSHHLGTTALMAKEFIQTLLSVREPFCRFCLRVRS